MKVLVNNNERVGVNQMQQLYDREFIQKNFHIVLYMQCGSP